MIKFTKRRSISSVIGGAVFLVLFITAFTVFMFGIQVTSDRFSEQLSSSFEDTLRGKETFTIAPTINNANKTFVEVFNKGPNPLNVQQVFIANVTNGGISVYDVSFQDSHVAPNERKNVLANHPDNPIKITSPGPYEVKVVTEQGTMVTQSFHSPLNGLFADLFTIPKNLGSGQNVTIALFVYNRGNSTVFNLAPVNDPETMTDPSTSIQGETFGPNPSTVSSLEPQESAFFTWEQQVVGAVGTQISYTNFARGTDGASGDTLDSNSDTSTIEFVPQAVSLIQKPNISILIPSPSGEDNTGAVKPLWGVNVLNPTGFNFTVSRVIITASPNDSRVTVFDAQGNDNCETVSIFPSSGTWSCPAKNVLQWINVGDPIVVLPRAAQAFFVQTTPMGLGAGSSDPATNTFVTVFSSYGPATQVAIPTGGYSGNTGSVVSLFVTNTNTTSGIIFDTTVDTLIPGSVLGNLQEIKSASNFFINMTLAVLSNNAQSGIATGRLIVNIPSGFKIISISDVDNKFGTDIETPRTFSDGSQQVRGDFTDLGLGTAIQKLTVTIGLTAPIVTTNATYTVIGIAEGTLETSGQPVGPLVEFPLQVLDVLCVGTPPVCPTP